LNTNTSEKSKISFIEVGAAQVDQRLDNFLLKTLKSVPKTRVYRIIRKGEVRVNKANFRFFGGIGIQMMAVQ